MRIRSKRGIALPLAIFIVTLLTITLAAAFARIGAEQEISAGANDAVKAFGIAQSGLNKYLAVRTTRPPNGDSLRINVTGGYADVVAWIVQRNDTLHPMYVVRSTGYVITPTAGAQPRAARTVAQFAKWQAPTIRTVAAFTAANGLDDTWGGTIIMSGNDTSACPNPAPSIRSIRHAAVGGSTSLPYTAYYPSSPAMLRSGGPSSIADTTGIDWAAITGGEFVPDYTTLSTGMANWSFKTHLITGNATLSDTWGSGLLIVTGDLNTGGNTATWYGVVIVGNEINFGSNATRFYGLVISGMNALTGPAPPVGAMGGGGKVFHVRYASCYVTASLAALGTLTGVSNGWVDDWATY